MLALRLTEGLSGERFAERYGHMLPREFDKKASFFASKGLMTVCGERYSLTPQGFLLSNSIIFELIDTLEVE